MRPQNSKQDLCVMALSEKNVHTHIFYVQHFDQFELDPMLSVNTTYASFSKTFIGTLVQL